MTYEEWYADNYKKKQEILERLQGKSPREIVDYFDYDNMILREPDYCPLYKDKMKCHNMDDLNCFFCACPYFLYGNNNNPIEIDRDNNTEIMSKCSIKSKFKDVFTYIQDDTKKKACDCSGCYIPHKKEFVYRYIKNKMFNNPIEDSCSLLELIRTVQLNDILGNYRVF